jgi:hypothetical protein
LLKQRQPLQSLQLLQTWTPTKVAIHLADEGAEDLTSLSLGLMPK